ncbi:hypothetical protein WICPIJ_004244 [Wickerhamomyces pijperi]|uniref:Glycoside hydrolase family 5 domain-containing protein n=1 Tax=Wickerhamomyces pijperi TaxID=599730 RepID=A0A9P8Q821_WICPI|nr:hypothetical protein WICPIJ_004244 [Wickerhamomyces pijperi]
MGLFSRILNNIEGANSQQLVTTPPSFVAPKGQQPDRRTIFRNRQNFGVNFGSLFVQEKWICDRFFINNTNNELDAISAYIDTHGLDKTKEDLQDHWNNYVTDSDWQWLREKNVTAIRLPIGYWHVDNGRFTRDTPFAKIAVAYSNSWTAIQNIFKKANQYDIGILIDLHGLPGGANGADHSGTASGRSDFWNESRYQTLAIESLQFITNDCQKYENFVALQIVNESVFSEQAISQKHYYANAIRAVRQIDSSIPIIISDGWWADQWVKWLSESESRLGCHSGVVIDSHIYRCFDDSDKNKSPEQIINDLGPSVLTNLSSSADFVIGEYSCVLAGESWSKTNSDDRPNLAQRYGQAQSSLFIERANFGYFFWTFKFRWGDGGEWGFVPQVNSGALLSQVTQLQREIGNEEMFKEALNGALTPHRDYWNAQDPSTAYEHWRFEDGFKTAWMDASAFARFNGSRLGRLNAWKSSRRQEYINSKGDSGFMWEWDHGFDQGLKACCHTLFYS